MITKIHAAEKQLDTAIKLFFENVDHLSAYALATASLQITDDIFANHRAEILGSQLVCNKGAGQLRFSFREEFEMKIKPEYIKEVRDKMRAPQNFLKHADRDSDGFMESLTFRQVSNTLLAAVSNFNLVASRCTTAMSMFSVWPMANNPKLLKKDVDEQFKSTIAIMSSAMRDLFCEEIMYGMYKALEVNCPDLFPKRPLLFA